MSDINLLDILSTAMRELGYSLLDGTRMLIGFSSYLLEKSYEYGKVCGLAAISGAAFVGYLLNAIRKGIPLKEATRINGLQIGKWFLILSLALGISYRILLYDLTGYDPLHYHTRSSSDHPVEEQRALPTPQPLTATPQPLPTPQPPTPTPVQEQPPTITNPQAVQPNHGKNIVYEFEFTATGNIYDAAEVVYDNLNKADKKPKPLRCMLNKYSKNNKQGFRHLGEVFVNRLSWNGFNPPRGTTVKVGVYDDGSVGFSYSGPSGHQERVFTPENYDYYEGMCDEQSMKPNTGHGQLVRNVNGPRQGAKQPRYLREMTRAFSPNPTKPAGKYHEQFFARRI